MLNDSNRILVAAAPTPIGFAYMTSATGYITDDIPSTLRIPDASRRVRINLIGGSVKDYFLLPYKDGKCTIADLIWWELTDLPE